MKPTPAWDRKNVTRRGRRKNERGVGMAVGGGNEDEERERKKRRKRA